MTSTFGCDHHNRRSDDLMKDLLLTDSAESLRPLMNFFVRPMTGRTIVMTGYRDEPVKSVLNRLAEITKIPMSDQRLIYKGKQLQLEKTLEECGIENDSILSLVARLRSGGYPVAMRIVDYMVSVVTHIYRGTETTSFDLNTMSVLVTRHFTLPGFVEVFTVSPVPSMLVSLYLTSNTRKLDAESCVSQFMSCCHAAGSQNLCGGAVLVFCKELKKSGCEVNDSLYLKCRDTLGFLLEKVGVLYGSGDVKKRISLRDVFCFVPEIAERVLKGLDCSRKYRNLVLSPGDVSDLGAFLKPLRSRIRVQQSLGVFLDVTHVSDGIGKCNVKEEDDELLFEEIDYLRVMFLKFLCKMNECFSSMAVCLVSKEQQGVKEAVVVYSGWLQYLNVLKEMYEISKVFDGAEDMFWRILMRHKNMLTVLVVGSVRRDGNDHMWILDNRSVTNFEIRRHLATALFPSGKEDYDLFHEMLIDRSQLLPESFEYIGSAKPESLRSGLFMEFKNEEATGPGVLREWFVLVCRAVFNPQNALFVACPNDCRRFYPNPASKVHPRHLEYFRFIGRIIALALMRKVQVGIVFDRVFFTQLAGKKVTLEDIRDADPYLYRSCKQILEMDADFIDSDALGLTFVRETEELGCRKVVELCPGGRSLVLNSKNRGKYVDLLIQSCFVTSMSEQISHFTMGFTDIISNSRHRQFFQSLDLGDLDWMLHGSENTISIEDWKAHTKYTGYKETDRQISWFWEIVGRMSMKQRMILLFFWTSVQYLPVEGFRGLASPVYICRSVEPVNHLPSSHTCFYQLCFPQYSSMSVMQERFSVITQDHIGCSFGTS